MVYVPGSPDSRPRRIERGRALGCAVLGILLAACGSQVSGHPSAESQRATVTRHIASDLGAMLPTGTQFPDAYPPVARPGAEAVRTDQDLSGIPSGATVDPPGCASSTPSDPAQLAAVVGTDDNTRTSITVELIRTTDPLARLRTLLQRCGTVHAQRGPLTNTIVTQLNSPAPVNADDSLAWSRAVRGQRGGPGLTRSTRTLAAQIGDVRILATYLSFGDAEPDMAALDQVFTAAVGDVRQG